MDHGVIVISLGQGGDGPKYDVIHPITNKPCAIPERGWIYASPHEMQRQIKLGLVEFRGDHTEPPFRKAHIRPIQEETEMNGFGFEEAESDDKDDAEFATQVRGSYFYKQSQVTVRYLRNLMGAKVFSNPKDYVELARIIEYVTPQESDAIVMDFFAGSASTAEAVMYSNAVRGTNNRIIIVQLPENLEDALVSTSGSAKKTTQNAIAMLEAGGKPKVLTEVAKERIRRSGKKILEGEYHENWNKDIGFRVLKIDTSNMKDVYYTPDEVTQEGLFGQIDNIKVDRTDEDLLFQVLLDWGVDLSLPIHPESIDGKTVYFVDTDALAACFETGVDEDFVKHMAERKPLRAVFRDSGYGSDNTKINVEQIFNLISPTTEVKTI
jgi:adenine-specific DNA-methyltransferase